MPGIIFKYIIEEIINLSQDTKAIMSINHLTNSTTDEETSFDSETKKLTFGVNFATKNQSLWKTGTAFSYEDDRFLGVTWDNSKNLLALDTPFNRKFTLDGLSSGKIGLESSLKIQSGTLKASLPIDLWINVPQNVKPGETITITSGFTLNKDATFKTFSPSASYSLDAVLNLNSSFQATYGEKTGSLLDVNVSKTQNILSYDSTESNSSIPLDSFGSADIKLPTINTEDNAEDGVLSVEASDTFMESALDLDGLITTALQTTGNPIPSLQDDVSIRPFKGVSLSGDYNILDAELQTKLLLKQKFNLNVDSLTGQLILENGKKYKFTVGKDLTIKVPKKIGETLDIDAVVKPKATFTNTTSIVADVDAQLDLLQASFQLNFPLNTKFERSIGPLFSENYNIFDGEFTIYDQSFALKGLKSQNRSFNIPVDV